MPLSTWALAFQLQAELPARTVAEPSTTAPSSNSTSTSQASSFTVPWTVSVVSLVMKSVAEVPVSLAMAVMAAVGGSTSTTRLRLALRTLPAVSVVVTTREWVPGARARAWDQDGLASG